MAATTLKAYEAERRRLIRQRAAVASLLALVLVPLFGAVDYFMYRPHFAALMSARLVSCLTSCVILLLLRGPFGRRYALGLAIALSLEVGFAIAVVPVAVTGSNTPHYVSMALLILSLAALFPWAAAEEASLSAALASTFVGGAVLHGEISSATAFGTQVSAIVVTSVMALIVTRVSEQMRSREFWARRALRAASKEKTHLIDDLRKTTGELAALNTQLGALNQEMEDLLYVASHDLRAPLINVQGFATEVRICLTDLRAYTNGAPEAKAIYTDTDESLGFIDSAVHRMDGLIQGLLNVSRIATRTHPTEEVRLQEVVEKIIESFRYQLDQSRIRVTLDALPSVRGDTVRLTQVFSNLIDNAIKYMGEGPLRTIEIGMLHKDGAPALFVKDSGPGIPVESQEAVFRLFRRLGNQVPGEGLGLTMVRKIIEKHGGRIWVESTPGRGSTFYFTLAGALPRMHNAGERPQNHATT